MVERLRLYHFGGFLFTVDGSLEETCANVVKVTVITKDVTTIAEMLYASTKHLSHAEIFFSGEVR